MTVDRKSITTSKLAEYPLPLRNFLEVDRDGGHVSFCYPFKTGSLTSVLKHIDDLMGDAMQRRGADRTAALNVLKAFITRNVAEDELVSQQWDLELKKREVAREASQFSSKATKGGPTATNPDRPYCKSDQSCCDFICGN